MVDRVPDNVWRLIEHIGVGAMIGIFLGAVAGWLVLVLL